MARVIRIKTARKDLLSLYSCKIATFTPFI
uniref:Uncharacterized protein n=1 Tax=Siphoviridae sp. ctxMM9 TaxID=2827973 RepID=A0A8S5T6L7_9CAUD|nr:MAG TPA: hypothetical protein [Siphoviridae sp. ctxMM9]